MKIKYESRRFNRGSLIMISYANDIIEEYQKQGFTLTLRQLYYQFVSRDLIPNSIQSYKRLGSIINDARMAGLISWEAIEDRTRNLQQLASWDEPADILRTAMRQYRIDRWDNQPYRLEVWIEKDALVGVIQRICDKYRVPYFACRGYNSQSEQWNAGMRLKGHIDNGQTPVIFHLGDHNPSGIDMTRDNEERLSLFAGERVLVERLALNMDQVQQYNPPPNPAKLTDTRAQGYIDRFGMSSWELAALSPSVIENLISDAIYNYLDEDLWDESRAAEEKDREKLRAAIEVVK